MVNLTSKQKILIEIAKQKGEITLNDARIVYASPIARKEALQRLVLMKLLKRSETVVNKFEYIGEILK